MKRTVVTWIIPVGLAVLGAVSLCIWISSDVAIELTRRVPIVENLLRPFLEESPTGKIQGELLRFDGVASNLPGAWPRFRGANFDAISNEDVALLRTWGPEGPKVLWSIEMGEGYAGAAILAGRVYILDYDHKKQVDVVRCLSLADGEDIWQYSYGIKVKRQHGMSRTVPAVTDKYIVTLGPKCHVTCLDSTNGQFRWMLDLVKDFKTEVPSWYAGQCPLIDGDRAIIGVGGEALMIAVDCETGKIVWRTANQRGWGMTHSSVMPIDFAGKRMYVYCASGGVVGVAAEDGSILWEYPEWKIKVANVPSPVAVGEGLIFLSGGYNAGSVMLRLVEQGGGVNVQEVFRLTADVFGSPQHTPIFYNGYIYGVRPDEQLACLDLNGKVLWTSTSAHKFGLGPFMIANGLIYVMNDSGLLIVAEATPAGYNQLAEHKVLDGPESWGPMAMASGRLIVRDLTRMICLDIAER